MPRSAGSRTSLKKGAPKDTGRKVKKKPCMLCRERVEWVDYKDVDLLRRYMSDRGKIRARRVTGNCARHQRDVAVAIKNARELMLLPYTQRAGSERGAARSRLVARLAALAAASAQSAAGGVPRAEARDAGGRTPLDGQAEAAASPPAEETPDTSDAAEEAE
jgi:small subunit ribosomal protein S18